MHKTILSVVLLCVVVMHGQERSATFVHDELEFNSRIESLQRDAPLHWALRYRKYDAALKAMPLTRNVDSAAKTEFGIESRPICLAAQDPTADAYDMVRALIKRYGADPNLRDGNGLTALHYAAGTGNLAVAELLLANGADVNAGRLLKQGDSSQERGHSASVTPLLMAYSQGRYRTAKLLEEWGADDLDEQFALTAKAQGALSAGYRMAEQNLPDGLEPIEALRFKSGIALEHAQNVLVENGFHREAQVLGKFEAEVLEIVEDVPLPSSGGAAARAAWMNTVQAKAWHALQSHIKRISGASDNE